MENKPNYPEGVTEEDKIRIDREFIANQASKQNTTIKKVLPKTNA